VEGLDVLRIALAVFVACFAVLVAARVYLPWWGFLIAVVGVFLAMVGTAWLLAGRFMTSVFSIPFRAKGAALGGAKAEVHSVEAVPADVTDEGPGPEGSGAYDRYRLDVTIRPRATPGPFLFWEPGELVLVPAKTRVTSLDTLPEGAGVMGVEVFANGAFGPDDEGKYVGPRRLRFDVHIPRDWDRTVAFLYYFSKFGTVTLPPAAATDRGGGDDARDRGDAARGESTRR
jgi:hypothetical protein